jgi:hypothetical protein
MTDDVRIPRLSTSHDASKQRLVSDEKLRLDAAFDRVADMPEHRKDGWSDMLELRQAVEVYLRRWG